MNKLIVENKKIEKICSFYVSDYHLEMVLIPYINEKLSKNEEIEIISEKDLRETVNALVSKMNINECNKKKILELNWDKSKETELKENKAELKNDIVYLDLSKEFVDNHVGGEKEESTTIYSIVNTLTELTEVNGVKILIDGKEDGEFKDGKIKFTNPFVKTEN